jgi:putative ABC transport system permease protein
MGRLKSTVSIPQADAEMKVVTKRLADAFPKSNTGWSASVEPLKNNFLSNDTVKGLWLLLGAVGFVLLIACANVASLLLARGTLASASSRSGALGASREEIVRQFITESVVLALVGGVVGVGLAAGLLQIIMTTMPRSRCRRKRTCG